VFLVNTASFFYTARRGKFLEWERILDRLQLRGDEIVLDMGCGRAAVLTAVAGRLTTGRVTGVDIWGTTDQSGNAKDVALRNASLEGVSDRVHIETADMRALPFSDATFDLVVSSLAIHNGVEILVGQSSRGHNPPHGFKIPGLASDNRQELFMVVGIL
jgi:SAM-dependent methyltransferase